MNPQPDRVGQPIPSWGHKIRERKQDGILRVGLLNHGGFSVQAGSTKDKLLLQYIRKYDFDIIALTESNQHWKNVPIEERLPERTRGWWEAMHLNTSYYKDFPVKNKFQPGGVSLWSLNQAAHRVMSADEDPTGLGRWSSTRYRGKLGISVRAVSAYRPVLNKKGVLSVWNQQKSYFDEHKRTGCPRDLFIEDLQKEIKKWKEAGDQIVLMLDVNEDVRTGKFTEKMRSLGLIETVTSQHGINGPPTYEKGKNPIDGIYVSSTLQGLKCGYLDFIFDHRCLWMDIPVQIAFGHTIPPSIARRARRLNCNDPRIVKKYLKVLTTYLEERNMYQKVDELFQATSFPLTANQAQTWESLDKIHMTGLRLADSKCRKFKTGEIPWSPQYQVIRSRIDFWNLMVKKLSGGSVQGYYLRRKGVNAQL